MVDPQPPAAKKEDRGVGKLGCLLVIVFMGLSGWGTAWLLTKYEPTVAPPPPPGAIVPR